MDKCIEIIKSLLLEVPEESISDSNILLERLSNHFQADACVVWKKRDTEEMLLTIADWFKNTRQFNSHTLKLNSITGKAIMNSEYVNVTNVNEEKIVNTNTDFWKESNLNSFCTIPITFPNKKVGAINFYKKEIGGFGDQEIEQLKIISTIIPSIFIGARERISFKLLKEINESFNHHEFKAEEKEEQNLFSQITKTIAHKFRAKEVTIFLKIKNKFTKVGSNIFPQNRTYADSISLEVTKSNKAVKYYNLSKIKISNLAKDEFSDLLVRAKENHKSLPISFIAVPILKNNELVGIIRCSCASKQPYYFSNFEVDLLRLVSTRISTTLRLHEKSTNIKQENKNYDSFNKAMLEINNVVIHEMNRQNPKSERIYYKILGILHKNLKNADVLNFRFYDKQKNCLYFKYTYGEEWRIGSKDEINERLNKKFPIDKTSAGAKAYKSRETIVIDDTNKNQFYDMTFPNAKRMIISPIFNAEKEFLAILDIRSTSSADNSYPRSMDQIVSLISSQIGLCITLVDNLEKLSSNKRILNETFSNYIHQLKGPVTYAYEKISLVQSACSPTNKVYDKLYPVKGLIGKALRVAKNVELFSSLAKGEKIKVHKTNSKIARIYKLAKQISQDNFIVTEKLKNIKYQITDIDKELAEETISIDFDLLEQSINNIIENAFKYSYSDTVITISISRINYLEKEAVKISIINDGIPINNEQATKCVEQNWRSPEAKYSTGEGKGIGLWIVKKIMDANQAHLKVHPTKNGLNEFSLILNIIK